METESGIVVFYPGGGGLTRFFFRGMVEKALRKATVMFLGSHVGVRVLDIIALAAFEHDGGLCLKCPDKSELTIQLRKRVEDARKDPKASLNELLSDQE